MAIEKAVAEQKAHHIQQLLKAEGFAEGELSWDEQSKTWDLVFKYEKNNCLLMTDAEDTNYVSILLPNFWEIESAEELERAYRAANRANLDSKGAKVQVKRDESNLVAAVEFVVENDQALTGAVFFRYLGMLTNVANTFVNIMRENG
ncbi:hypothetical protein VQ643_03070 [Pseudomonas sp. F1_0610]|uniref:hypothetical protein n=1 Tax=Pseudomonas sp. F1_0610 TaxID=3114284 RepID=UPI0039C27D2B